MRRPRWSGEMTTETTTLMFVEAPTIQLINVPIELINNVPAPTQKARQQSLIELGQVDPVRLRPAEDGRFSIVDGRRRIANLIANKAQEVKALVEFIDDDQADLHALALNISRSPSPMIEARKSGGLIEKGYTQQQIAQMLGVTQGFISQRLGLLDLIPVLQTRLELGQMTLTAARAARKLPVEDQERLATLDKITVQAALDMLRGYQAKMVDLSSIDIPDTGGHTINLSNDDIEILESGQGIIVKIGGNEYKLLLRNKEQK